jgi:hydrogenase 3 maturation protease
MNPFLGMLEGKVVIAGIGNPIRGDDGLGCYLVNRLKDRVKALCVDTGATPENYLGKIMREKPDTLLLIDAMHLDKQPGEFAIMQPEELAQQFPATHGFPLRMWIDQFSHGGAAKVFFLGVQPQNVAIGETLSAPIQTAVRRLEEWIVEAANI